MTEQERMNVGRKVDALVERFGEKVLYSYNEVA